MKQIITSINKAMFIVVWVLLLAGVSFLISITILEGLPKHEVKAKQDLNYVTIILKQYIKDNDQLQSEDKISSSMLDNSLTITIGNEKIENIRLNKNVEIKVSGTVSSYNIQSVRSKPEFIFPWDRK